MKKSMHLVATAIVSVALSACALVNERQYYYGFEFDNHYDGQTALVVDYKLMSKDRVLISARQNRMPILSDGIYVNGPRPTSIYIKWKDSISDAEFERSIDLRRLLIDDLDSQTIYLMFIKNHLTIYLVSQNPRPANEPVVGPGLAHSSYIRKIIYSE